MKNVDMMMILNRAYNETLRIWAKEKDILEANPGNKIAQYKMEMYQAQLDEMHGMILAEERKLEKLRQENAKRV